MSILLKERKEVLSHNRFNAKIDQKHGQEEKTGYCIDLCCSAVGGYLTISGERVELLPGILVAGCSNEIEQLDTTELKGSDWRYVRVNVSLYPSDCENKFVSLQRLCKESRYLHYPLPGKMQRQVIELLDKMQDELEKKDYSYEVAVQSYFMELFLSLERAIIHSRKSARGISVQDLHYHPKVNKIIHYIERYYREDLTVDRLAEHYQISKPYLCSLFKKITGTTVIQWARTVWL